MKGKYRINIEPAEGCNPDFAPDEEATEGFECDGYIVIGFDGDEVVAEGIAGLSTAILADYIRENGYTANILRQACALAEGLLKAFEIEKEYKTREAQQDLIEKLKGLLGGKDD